MNEIPTIDPEIEPEYVGAYSGLADERCCNWFGETTHTLGECGQEATHSVVMASGSKLSVIAMCDDCGEPNDVRATDREWSGEVVSEKEGDRA